MSMTITEFRKQYPVYDDMSDIDLAKAMHDKHYSDMDFGDFAKKFMPGYQEADKVEGYARSAVEGLTIGWGDELMNASTAFGNWLGGDDRDFSDRYDAARSKYKQEHDKFKTENPKGAFAAELAGGLATPMVALNSLKAATGLQRAGQLAGLGATTGAIGGAGFAEDGQRASGAATGAVVGGTLAPALPVAGNALLQGSRKVGNVFQGISGKDVVDRKIAEALKRGGFNSADDVKKALTEMGDQATIADVSLGSRSLAEQAAALPGKAKEVAEQVFVDRNAGAGRRTGEMIDSMFGGRVKLTDLKRNLIQRAEQEASPLYNQAHNTEVVLTDNLEDLLKNPEVARAFNRAKRIAKNEGVALPKLYGIDANGKPTLTSIPDMRTWDYIKRGLDDAIDNSGTGTFGKVNELGKSILSLKSRLLEDLDKQVPVYAEARKVFSGIAQANKAAEKGKNFWNLTDGEVNELLATMSQGEKDAFRWGALQKVYQEARKTTHGGSVENRLFNSAEKMDKIKAMLQDDEAYKRLGDFLRNESIFNKTYHKTTQGSQTAEKLLGASEGTIEEIPSFLLAATQGIRPAAVNLAGRVKNLTRPSMAQRAQYADRLMSQGDEAQKVAELIFQNPSLFPIWQKYANTWAGSQGAFQGLFQGDRY